MSSGTKKANPKKKSEPVKKGTRKLVIREPSVPVDDKPKKTRKLVIRKSPGIDKPILKDIATFSPTGCALLP